MASKLRELREKIEETHLRLVALRERPLNDAHAEILASLRILLRDDGPAGVEEIAEMFSVVAPTSEGEVALAALDLLAKQEITVLRDGRLQAVTEVEVTPDGQLRTKDEKPMDPNVTLLELLQAIESADSDRAVGLAEDLALWMGRDGFPPAALQACLAAAKLGADS